MPIYEFYCATCNTVYNFLSRTIQPDKRPFCPHCKKLKLSKKDEIFGYASQGAKERVRSSFILDAIAQAEKITVTEAEMEERLESMATRYRIPVDKLKAQLDERGGLGEVEEQILVAKTLDFLLANAKVEATKA